MTATRKKPNLGRSKSKIARKGKSAQKLVKKLLKTEGGKKGNFTEVSAKTTYREARSNSRSARMKKLTQKIRLYFRN